ncbi:MAG: RHS repeat domain-containing protein [Armatimonadota bacterium]
MQTRLYDPIGHAPEGGILEWFEALGAPPGQIGWTDIEYVYGPDYVDEFMFILNEAGQPLYVLQDANSDVMGLTNATGGVVEQYAWSPYGELIAVDPVGAGAPRHVPGHQGLFFVRLDGNPADPSLEVGARGLYYNRNRWYSPRLGRFIQRDVNETALPIITAPAFNGDTLDALVGVFDGQALYADGFNLYAYLDSNPVNLTDALGLYDDSWLDDFIDEYTGHRLYALGTINEGARWASLGLQTALDIAGALIGLDVFESVELLASGRGGFWDSMNIVLAAAPGAGPVRALLKARKFRFLASEARIARASANLFRKFGKHWKGGKRSLEYHWRKHAERLGVSIEDYTNDAVAFWKTNRHRAEPFPIESGMKTGFKLRGHPGGIFTSDGKIVTFWYE